MAWPSNRFTAKWSVKSEAAKLSAAAAGCLVGGLLSPCSLFCTAFACQLYHKPHHRLGHMDACNAGDRCALVGRVNMPAQAATQLIAQDVGQLP